MNQSYTKTQRVHLARVKELPCSVCNEPGPSDAHHIRQTRAFSVVALCKSCHQDPHNGIHGEKAMWRIMKMDEVDALAVMIERLLK